MATVAEIVRHYVNDHWAGHTLNELAEQLRSRVGAGSDTSISAWKSGLRQPAPQAVEALRRIVRCQHSEYSQEAIRQAFTLANDNSNASNASNASSRGAALSARQEIVGAAIDDVFVSQSHEHVQLDIRVRNSGDGTINVTRMGLRILKRIPYLTAYVPSASYDMLVDGDYTEIPVAHVIRPGDVDSFLVRLGFSAAAIGHVFTAEVVLHFNGSQSATSKELAFDSCFG